MNTVLFDLDGTLLPMEMEVFVKGYVGGIIETMTANGRDGKLIADAVFEGVGAMIHNDGTKVNEDVFWNTFEIKTGIAKKDIIDEFVDFYVNKFDEVDTGVTSPNMLEAVATLKEKGYKLYLTTNPLFPRIATEKRIKWAGLNINDFELVTTYEDTHYCKPNIKYYLEVINKHNLDVNQCLMVGNDVKEDGIIETIGVPVYLVDDCLLNKDNIEITSKYKGSSKDFLEFVKQLPIVK